MVKATTKDDLVPKPSQLVGRRAGWWALIRGRPDLAWLVLLGSLWVLALVGNFIFGLAACLRVAQLETAIHHLAVQRAEAAQLQAGPGPGRPWHSTSQKK